MHLIRQLPLQLEVFRCRSLLDLVADAPHHDAWMVARTADDGGEIFAPVLVEMDRVILRLLAIAPDVEGLRHHHQAMAVAGIEESRGEWIVRRPQRIEAARLEQP